MLEIVSPFTLFENNTRNFNEFGLIESMDVELLVYELQLKLMLEKISFEDIVEIFYAKCTTENKILLRGIIKQNFLSND